MRSRFFWIIPLLILSFTSEGWALDIFKRSPKPDPAERVPVLIKTLQTDPDERKRATAAAELHEYDTKAFPDITPTLIAALHNDINTSVRLKAATSIGKLRPITQPAVYALEQAVQKDPSFRVRAEAKSILVRWNVFEGVKPSRGSDKRANETEEPPLADPLPGKVAPTRSMPTVGDSAPEGASSPNRQGATPKPTATRPLLPFLPTKNVKPSKSADDGPTLNPPM